LSVEFIHHICSSKKLSHFKPMVNKGMTHSSFNSSFQSIDAAAFSGRVETTNMVYFSFLLRAAVLGRSKVAVALFFYSTFLSTNLIFHVMSLTMECHTIWITHSRASF
jgi:hypothetical protein